jgi:type II secretory pathway component PulC
MGKKAKLYLIVVINLLAWGYVGYKVYGALQGDDDIELTNTTSPIKKMDDVVTEDNLSLALNYPDPFLKNGNFSNAHTSGHTNSGTVSQVKTNKPLTNNHTAKPTPSVAVVPTLTIKYLGLLKNNDKGTQTAMLSINDRSVFAKQNDVIEGYTIIDISREAIKIKKGKEVLTISK